MSKSRILVVDDIPDVNATLSGLLSDEGYDVRSAHSKSEALHKLKAERFHVAVLDVRLDDSDDDNQDGLVLMHEINEKYPAVAVIILTGYATVKMVQEALQRDQGGVSPAFGFLEKSDMGQLPEYVRRALECKSRAIQDMISQEESECLEFKSSMRWDYKEGRINKNLQEVIAKAIAGMLNGEGGTLLIGVADDGSVLGIENDLGTLRKQDTDGFELLLTDIVKTYLGVEHMEYIHPSFEVVDGKQVCAVLIQKSPEPVFVAKGDSHTFWVRAGNSTHSLDVRAATKYMRIHWKKDE